MNRSAPLSVSVIVATYNEETDIERTMEALAALDYPALEILVIDDASKDRTLDIVRCYEGRIQNLRILPQTINRGVAASRNVGLREAKGAVTIILNADVCPKPDFIRQIVPYYQEDRADYVAVNAQVMNTETIYARYIEARHIHDQRSMDLDAIHWTEGWSCRREIALAVGGFPEEFPGASGEDAVFTEALTAAGYRRALDFSIIVPHVAPPTLYEFWQQRMGRGRGGAYRLFAYEKRPAIWWRVLFSTLATLLLVALMIPALRYAWELKEFSPEGRRDWLGLAWAHTVDRIGVAIGYWRGFREIIRKQRQAA